MILRIAANVGPIGKSSIRLRPDALGAVKDAQPGRSTTGLRRVSGAGGAAVSLVGCQHTAWSQRSATDCFMLACITLATR